MIVSGRFQRQQPSSGGTVRSLDLQIVVISSLQTVSSTVFRIRVSFAAATLTHYSTMPHRPSDSSRPMQRLLLSGDVHLNPGPATKYPCSVCTSNVTSRAVTYMCNRCSGWVSSKCSRLQNAAEYRRIKNWVCSSCSSPPTPQIPKLLPSPTTTKASDGDPFTILQFNTNGIGNKQVELGDFLERHRVKVGVIQESKLTLNSRTPNIQNFTTVRKDRDQGQGGGLLTMIHKSINFTRYSSRSSFGRVHYYSQAGKHRHDHYQHKHTPSKLLHRRIQSISGSSDDDDGHPHTGRLQRSPLIVVFKFYRYESMVSGSFFRYSKLGFYNRIAGQCQPKFP